MTTPNKFKLFLLLTFGFVFLFTQNSFAQYIDTTKHCATFTFGTFNYFNNLKKDEMCVIDKIDLPSWDKYSMIGLRIDEIKIPYGSVIGRQGLWEVIKNTTTSQNEWGTSTCNDTPASGIYYGSMPLINVYDIVPFLTVPKTYYNVKTAIIRSCLPGKITTSNRTDLSNAICRYYTCRSCKIGFFRTGTCCNHGNERNRTMTYNSANFPTWEFEGCGLSDEGSMSLSSNAPVNSNTNRQEVYEEGSFTLNWSLSDPSSSCTLSGKNATNPSETFERKIEAGAVGINATNGQISPKSDSYTFNYAKEGIYKYTLSCAGVLDGRTSPTRGVITKSITIYVGDIPPNPTINTFEIIESEDLVKSTTADNYYEVPINKSIQFKWDVKDADSAPSARPVKIWRQKGSEKKILLSTNTINNLSNPQTIRFADSDRTGIYTFWLEVAGEKFPELTSESQNKINVRAWNAADPDVPEVTFSADKTEIEKGEGVFLTWNVSGSSDVSIDHEVGKVQPSGSTSVYPNVTTTYALVAKNPAAGNPDTKKTITIVVGTPSVEVPELVEFTPPEDVEFEGQEGAPTEKGEIDLKVNKVDGPVTLNAPATFTLSWNLDTYCLATGSWLGIKTKAGSETITLKKNGKYTYNLYCPGGYGSDSVVVEIVNSSIDGLLKGAFGSEADASIMPVAEVAASTDLINYSQNIKVLRGEPTNIYVKVDMDVNGDGQVSHDTSGIWGDYMTNGGYCLYNDGLVKGTPQFTGMVASPETRESCNAKLGTFTFNDEPGTYQYGIFRMLQNDQKFSNIAYINIVVENPPLPTSGPVIDLKVNGNSADEQVLGTPASYSVTWDVKNATSCEASGSWIGTKAINGIQNFVSSSKKDFVYTLTCVGELGTSTKTINLKVVESPTCTFTAMPPSINKTSSFITDSELYWTCDFADSCTISPEVSTDVKTYGTLRVSPAQTTDYTLTCSNSSVSKSFEVKIEVIQ